MPCQWSSRLFVLLIGTSLPAFLSGCLSTPQPGVTIHESKLGSVSLAYTQDYALRATHPASLDSRILERVLRGIQVQEQENVIEKLFASEAKQVRAFSDEETAFLAPLLANALTQATSGQEVKFRVAQQDKFNPLTTGGTLYVVGPLLHLTLTHYRAKPYTPDTIYMANRQVPGSTGTTQPLISFILDPPLPTTSTSQSVIMERPDPSTLVINYKVLSSLPQQQIDATATPQREQEKRPIIDERKNNERLAESPPANTPKNVLPDSEDLRRIKDLVIKKDLEMEALKDEVRGLREQLSERDTEIQVLQNEVDSLKKKAAGPRSQKKAP